MSFKDFSSAQDAAGKQGPVEESKPDPASGKASAPDGKAATEGAPAKDS